MPQFIQFAFTEEVGSADLATADEATARQTFPELWVCPLVGLNSSFVSVPDDSAAVEDALDVRAVDVITVSDSFFLKTDAVLFIVELTTADFFLEPIHLFFVRRSLIILCMLIWAFDNIPSETFYQPYTFLSVI